MLESASSFKNRSISLKAAHRRSDVDPFLEKSSHHEDENETNQVADDECRGARRAAHEHPDDCNENVQ